MLMSSADRGVERDRPVQLAVRVRADEECLENYVPGAVSRPGAVALSDCLPGPEVAWHVAPGDPAPVPIDDPLDHLSMIASRTT